MTSRGRRSRSRPGRRSDLGVPRPHRSIRTTVIDPAGLERLKEGVLTVLCHTGMQVEDRQAVDLLVSAGCRERDERIFYPPDVVLRALESVPKSIRFYTQDGAQAVDTSEATPRFGSAANCVQVLDPFTSEYRPCLLSDIANHGRVQQALPHIDFAASLGYPSDVPVEDEALLTVRALLETTSKPIFFTGHDEHIVRRIWDEMAGTVGGKANMAAKPIGLDLIGPVSPLRLGDESCQRLIMAAREMLPVVCYPAIFPGMACPLTLAGAIVQSSAESLAGIVISQLAQPGAPVMSGASIMPMDMRRADMAIGSPEYALAGLGAAELFQHVGVPSWVGSGCTDAHDIGPQAFAEVSANLQATSLACTSLTHNLGVLSSGRTGSLEMLVACDEMAAMSARFAAGIVVDAETIGVDVIDRAWCDNSYLTDPHTLARYQTEMWMPGLFQRESLENWDLSGRLTLRERLRERVSSILNGA